MKYKFSWVLLSALILVGFSNHSYAKTNEIPIEINKEVHRVRPISVLVNGENLDSKYSPFLKRSRAFAPIREITEMMGAEVKWEERTKSVLIKLNGKEINLKRNSNIIYKNGNKIKLDDELKPELVSFYQNGKLETKTVVPLRFISESLDFEVDWDSKNKEVLIYSNGYKQVELIPQQVKKEKEVFVENPKRSIADNDFSIEGQPLATSDQMARFLLSKNPNPKIKISAKELAQLFIEEGKKENIRGDIAFCQSMKETGWLRYGGLVLPEQNNYAGIGALNDSNIGKGAWFSNERQGVRAQIQHLKAYANKEALKEETVDPRFHFVDRGVAKNWTDLNGKWAVPGNGYGESILKIHQELLGF